MSELPKSFGGPAMAMSEYYDPDAGDAEDDYDDEDNPAKVRFHNINFGRHRNQYPKLS